MRKQELDILRIYACFLVIVSHFLGLMVSDVLYSQWNTANILHTARNACVPLFFSLSGVLLLSRELSWKKLIRRVLYYAAIFIIASTFFQVRRTGELLSFRVWLQSVLPGVQNPAHLWYLRELLGIYLFLPVLVRIAKDKRLSQYYLAVWFFFMFFLRNAAALLPLLGDSRANIIASILDVFLAQEFLTYAGYLILGYYLYYHFDRRISWQILVALLAASIAAPAFLSWIYHERTNLIIPGTWEYYSVSAFVQTGCYVLITKQYVSGLTIPDYARKGLGEVSSSLFLVYVIHPIFTEATFSWVSSGNLWIRVPVMAIAVFLISLLICMALRTLVRKILHVLLAYDSLKRIYIVSVIALSARAIIMTASLCGIYADGAAVFIELLSQKRLNLWIPARKGGLLLAQLLPYVLVKIGFRDYMTLLYAFCLGCLLWVTLLVTASLHLCYKSGDHRLMNHTLILWGIVLPLGDMYCIHESFSAAAAMWFIFVCFKNWDYAGRYKRWIFGFLFILSYALLGLYESVALIGIVILLYVLVSRSKVKTMPVCPVCYFMGCLLLLANILLEVYYIRNPTLGENIQAGFFSQIFGQPRAIVIMLTLFAAFLLGAELAKVKEEGVFAKLLWSVEILLAGLYFLYVVFDPDRVVRECMRVRTFLNVPLPMAFILFEIMLLYIPNRRVSSIRILPVVMGMVCLFSAFGTGSGYYQYLKSLSTMTKDSRGFVTWDWDMSNPNSSYSIGWPIPYESVVASARFSPEDPIRSIAVQRKEDIYFQKFDTRDIDLYPDLTAYGIRYDKAAFDPTVYLPFTYGELTHINCAGEEWNADTLIEAGISHNETYFTWTDGNMLLFRPIQITQYDGSPLYLKLYIPGAYNAPQRLIAFCGEEMVYETTVESEGNVVEIPLCVDAEGNLQIHIELPDAVSPDMLEHTGDNRQLALMLTDIIITTEK